MTNEYAIDKVMSYINLFLDLPEKRISDDAFTELSVERWSANEILRRLYDAPYYEEPTRTIECFILQMDMFMYNSKCSRQRVSFLVAAHTGESILNYIYDDVIVEPCRHWEK